MIVGALIVALALGLVIALSVTPRRAFVAIPATLLAAGLLIEEAGVAPRGAIIVALLLGLLLATIGTRKALPTLPQPARAEVAWDRLTGAAGLLTRGRVTAIRRRRDLLVSRDAAVDPFSTFGELRIKLERRVPELIENYLDEAATAPKLRRHLLMGELLGEIEGLVARAEAVDPAALARSDHRTALRQHLRSGSDRDDAV